MPPPRMSKSVLLATVQAVNKAGGNRTQAAITLKIPYPTLAGRLRRARHQGYKILPPLTSQPVDEDKSNDDALLDELRKEQKKVADLTNILEKTRASKTKIKSVTPSKRRSGKDDKLRIIFPDLHGCYQDKNAVAAFLSDVKRLAPDEVIGLGDLIDAGGFLAQHHVWGYVAEAAYTYEDDILAANSFLDGLHEAAPAAKIELLEGNHCQRPERWCVTQSLRQKRDAQFLLEHYSPSSLLKLKERSIQYYRRAATYDNLSVQGTIHRGKCLFTHDANFGILHRYGTNVVHGHTHRVNSRLIHTVGSGTIGMWSLGCLSQRQPLWQHGKPTEWVHAYGVQVVARSGHFLHFTIPIIEGMSLLPNIKLG